MMTRFDDKLIALSVLRLSEDGATPEDLSFSGVENPELAIADLREGGATIEARDGRYSLHEPLAA